MSTPRTSAHLVFSILLGVAFATFMAAQTSMSLYYLGDAFIGSPVLARSIVRVALVSIWFILASYWTYVGVIWSASDISEAARGAWTRPGATA